METDNTVYTDLSFEILVNFLKSSENIYNVTDSQKDFVRKGHT